MATATFGQPNPNATDPYPIESVLAKEAVSGNAMAQMLLGNYQQKQQAASNVYGHELDQQHLFARDQLAQQMAEARLKAIPEFLARGQAGAELIAPGAGLGLGDNISPDAAARSLQASRTHEYATNLAEQGKGVESFSRAGQDIPLQQIPGLQNLRTTGAGEHSDITVQKLKDATSLKTAGMHARAAGGAGSAITTSFDVPNAYGGFDHASAGRKVTPAQIDEFRRSRGMVPVDAAIPAQPLPDQNAPASSNARSAPAPGTRDNQPAARSRTSLPPAVTSPQNQASGVAEAQRAVMAKLDTMRSHPAYPDLVQGMKTNGGKPIIKIENGKPVLYGASGRPL